MTHSVELTWLVERTRVYGIFTNLPLARGLWGEGAADTLGDVDAPTSSGRGSSGFSGCPDRLLG